MAGVAVKGRPGLGQCLFVQRRRHQAGQIALQRLLRGPLDTLAGKAPRRCTDVPVGDRAQRLPDLEHRQTARRHRQRLRRIA